MHDIFIDLCQIFVSTVRPTKVVLNFKTYCKINHEIVKMTNAKEFSVLSIIHIISEQKKIANVVTDGP